jgi:hypothetical protein
MNRLLLLLICFIALAGCSLFKQDKPYSANEAEKKLIAFCKKEGQIDVHTRFTGKTLWLFVALTEPLFDVKPNPAVNKKAVRKLMPWSLLSLDGEYNDQKQFAVRFDLVPDVLASEPTTYGSAYNENYTKKRQLIYQGLQETFFNVAPAQTPEFLVIFVADITKGLATKSTVYLPDLKAFLSEALPFDEYYLREQTEVLGDEKLIGDKSGRAVPYGEVLWPNFLTDQLKARIRFKLTQSDFPPEGKPDTEIIKIAANTFRFYPFKDYAGIYLYNMREKKEYTYTKDQLFIFEEKPTWQDKGKYTTIRFDGSKLMTGNAPQEVKPQEEPIK